MNLVGKSNTETAGKAIYIELQNSVRYLICCNLKIVKQVIVIFGALYPEIPGFHTLA